MQHASARWCTIINASDIATTSISINVNTNIIDIIIASIIDENSACSIIATKNNNKMIVFHSKTLLCGSFY